jgi:hypothetical protein
MADEGFLQRWSRRKAEARDAPEEAAAAEEQEGAAAAVPAAVDPPPEEDGEVAVDLDALPDIDSLTYESDFTGFMRKGVPPELRKRALQKLWRSNPTLANLDGLVEYGGDYTKIGMAKQVVRTAYQVGRGMLERLEPRVAEDQHATATAAAAAAAADDPERASEPQPAAAAPAREDTGQTAGLVSDREEATTEDRHRPRPRPLPKRG